MTTTTETPADALARIQSTHSKNDAQAVLQFYQAGVELDDCVPRETILTAEAWRALGKRIGKGATAQRVYGWRPVKKTDKKTGEEKDGTTPFTSMLFHESQMVDLKAPAGTHPAAWQNPALVKAGTYDETSNVIKANAVTPLVTPTPESEAFDAAFAPMPDSIEVITTPEIITIDSREQLERLFESSDAESDIVDAEFTRESLRITWTPPTRRIAAPATARRQLAMF